MLVVLLLHVASALVATEIVHVDLRQAGSSTIVMQPTSHGNRTIVIDFGMFSRDKTRGARRVIDRLQSRGIDHVDVAIVTHTDRDHVGGVQEFLGCESCTTTTQSDGGNGIRGPPIMPLDVVISPGQAPTTQLARSFVGLVADRNVPHITVRERDSLHDLEEDLGIRVFAARHPRTANDTSLVVAVIDSDRAGMHLITGDVTGKSWREIAPQVRAIGLPVLSMTAPHHGGERVLAQMIRDVSQKQRFEGRVIVSANGENPYRHPSISVIRDLARLNPGVRLRAVEAAREIAAMEDDAVVEYRRAVLAGIYQSLGEDGRREVRRIYGNWEDPGIGSQIPGTITGDEMEDHERIRLGMTPKEWKTFKRWVELQRRMESERQAPTHDSATDAHSKAVQKTVEQEQQRAQREGQRFTYAQLLVTGNVGDVTIKHGKVVSQPPGFFDEAAFQQIAYLTDNEIKELRTFDRARAYCMLKVAADLATLKAVAEKHLPEPAWATEYELILARLHPGRGRNALRANLNDLSSRSILAARKALLPRGKDETAKLLKLFLDSAATRRAHRATMRAWTLKVVAEQLAWATRRIRGARYDETITLPPLVFDKTDDDLEGFPQPNFPSLSLPKGTTRFDPAPTATDALRAFDQWDYEVRVREEQTREVQREIRGAEEKERREEIHREERAREHGRG
jgi:beta-lactamase superfamily II metal-dependent hydrolase